MEMEIGTVTRTASGTVKKKEMCCNENGNDNWNGKVNRNGHHEIFNQFENIYFKKCTKICS